MYICLPTVPTLASWGMYVQFLNLFKNQITHFFLSLLSFLKNLIDKVTYRQLCQALPKQEYLQIYKSSKYFWRKKMYNLLIIILPLHAVYRHWRDFFIFNHNWEKIYSCCSRTSKYLSSQLHGTCLFTQNMKSRKSVVSTMQ